MDLVALGSFGVPGEVGYPDTAVISSMDSMRGDEEPRSKVGENLAGVPVELEDGGDQVVLAVEGARTEGTGTAPLVCPDVAVIRIDVDTGRRAPTTTFRKLSPILRNVRSRIGDALTSDCVARFRSHC